MKKVLRLTMLETARIYKIIKNPRFRFFQSGIKFFVIEKLTVVKNLLEPINKIIFSALTVINHPKSFFQSELDYYVFSEYLTTSMSQNLIKSNHLMIRDRDC